MWQWKMLNANELLACPAKFSFLFIRPSIIAVYRIKYDKRTVPRTLLNIWNWNRKYWIKKLITIESKPLKSKNFYWLSTAKQFIAKVIGISCNLYSLCPQTRWDFTGWKTPVKPTRRWVCTCIVRRSTSALRSTNKRVTKRRPSPRSGPFTAKKFPRYWQ